MGRPPSVSEEEVVRIIALHPEPVVTAADVYDDIGLSKDGARERLKSMVDDGYLGMKRAGRSALVFYLKDSGRELLAEAFDE